LELGAGAVFGAVGGLCFMKLEDDILILSRVALFEGFTDEHLRLLAFGCERKTYLPNVQIFRDGQPGDFGFVVASGTVELYTRVEKKKVVFAEYGSGALIGEMAMISTNERPASALTQTDVTGYKIPQETFHRMLREYPDLALMLYRRISRSVEDFLHQLSKVQTGLTVAGDENFEFRGFQEPE
jgi:CRP-like cAMP-binding protein